MREKFKLTSYILKNLHLINQLLLERYANEDNYKRSHVFLNGEVYARNLLKRFFYYFDFPDDLFAIKTACENIEIMFEILSGISRKEDVYIIEQWMLVICIFRLDLWTSQHLPDTF